MCMWLVGSVHAVVIKVTKVFTVSLRIIFYFYCNRLFSSSCLSFLSVKFLRHCGAADHNASNTQEVSFPCLAVVLQLGGFASSSLCWIQKAKGVIVAATVCLAHTFSLPSQLL